MLREIDLRGDKITLERYRNAMDHVGKLLEGVGTPPPPFDEFLFPDDKAPPLILIIHPLTLMRMKREVEMVIHILEMNCNGSKTIFVKRTLLNYINCKYSNKKILYIKVNNYNVMFGDQYIIGFSLQNFLVARKNSLDLVHQILHH